MDMKSDSLNERPRLVIAAYELLLVVTAIAAISLSIYFEYSIVSFRDGISAAKSTAASEVVAKPVKRSATVDQGGSGDLNPPASPPPTSGGSSSTSDKCSLPIDPEKTSLADALGCMAIAIGTGIGTAIINGLKILFFLYVCLIIPIVSLLLAWLSYEIAQALERSSRECGARKHWWQRLWCWIKRILYYVLIVISILLVITAIVSVIACLVAWLL